MSVLGGTLDVVDVQLRHIDVAWPAGLARVDVLVNGQAVFADADWRACTACGVAVLEHGRTDPVGQLLTAIFSVRPPRGRVRSAPGST